MTLKTMIDNGYKLCAWTMRRARGENRVVVKLSKMTPRGERFYLVHSPQVETILSEVEFTEPVIIPEPEYASDDDICDQKRDNRR
jgi:hypothetical protein